MPLFLLEKLEGPFPHSCYFSRRFTMKNDIQCYIMALEFTLMELYPVVSIIVGKGQNNFILSVYMMS